jgi:predicted nucleic acid-binding protein
MPTSKLFVDTNVLMELFFGRSKSDICIQTLLKFDELYISNLSIVNLYYFAEKSLVDIQKLEEFIFNWNWLEVSNYQIQNALLIYNQDDFEDAVQISTCIENKIQNFLTLDKNLAKKYADKLKITLL